MKTINLRISHQGVDFAKRVWRHGLTPGSLPAIVFAVACIVTAALTRHPLGLIDPATIVFAPYFIALLAATFIGGLLSGIVALILGGLSAWWPFLPPTHALFPISQYEAINLLIYFSTGTIIIIVTESHRRFSRHYYEQERFNHLIISELQHRLRNKLATVQAVLGCYLRNSNGLRNEITGRLAAIGRTDELILKGESHGVEIAEIVTNEFQPYEAHSRIRLTGGSLLLPPMLALSLTLIIHELLTNAAKYGALSHQSGRISVTWTVDDTHVQVMWSERGRPAVHGPHHEGFGSELFHRALVPFHGTVKPEFTPDGFKCKIFFVLPCDRHAPSKQRTVTSI
jgi:two-component sensor histidine kinase